VVFMLWHGQKKSSWRLKTVAVQQYLRWTQCLQFSNVHCPHWVKINCTQFLSSFGKKLQERQALVSLEALFLLIQILILTLLKMMSLVVCANWQDYQKNWEIVYSWFLLNGDNVHLKIASTGSIWGTVR
jgi:hypothetical protein